VTLSEINITPLLDLAFVLLIIFVITTPLLEQSIPLNMYKGGQHDTPREKKDFRTVEITPQGVYRLEKHQMRLDQVLADLRADFCANPKLVVYIRADVNGRNGDTLALIDGCQRNGIRNYSLRTEPPKR